MDHQPRRVERLGQRRDRAVEPDDGDHHQRQHDAQHDRRQPLPAEAAHQQDVEGGDEEGAADRELVHVAPGHPVGVGGHAPPHAARRSARARASAVSSRPSRPNIATRLSAPAGAGVVSTDRSLRSLLDHRDAADAAAGRGRGDPALGPGDRHLPQRAPLHQVREQRQEVDPARDRDRLVGQRLPASVGHPRPPRLLVSLIAGRRPQPQVGGHPRHLARQVAVAGPVQAGDLDQCALSPACTDTRARTQTRRGRMNSEASRPTRASTTPPRAISLPGVRLIWILFHRSMPSKLTEPRPSGRSTVRPGDQVDAERRPVGLLQQRGLVGVEQVDRLRRAVVHPEVAGVDRHRQRGVEGVAEERVGPRLHGEVVRRVELAHQPDLGRQRIGCLHHPERRERPVARQEDRRPAVGDVAVAVADRDDRGVAVADQEHLGAPDVERVVDLEVVLLRLVVAGLPVGQVRDERPRLAARRPAR